MIFDTPKVNNDGLHIHVSLTYYPELSESAWPDGPYALLMPPAGCPEPVNRGWTKGYLHFSMTSTLFVHRRTTSVNNPGNDVPEVMSSDRGANIEGPFSNTSFRLNFCFKHAGGGSMSSSHWPDGNYTILGSEEACPEGKSSPYCSFHISLSKAFWR